MEHRLSEEQERHLADIKARAIAHLDRKYRRGAAEHTGNLWDLSMVDLIDNALDEITDLHTYLDACRGKLEHDNMHNTLLVQQLPGFVTHPPLKLHHSGDVGYDLYACMQEEVSISPSEFADIPCGIAIKLPPNTWGMIHPRSSTFWKRRLMVHAGIIDNGYTGPLKVGVWNPNDKFRVIRPLESLAQLIIMPIVPLNAAIQVSELPQTDRGKQGFGSTGSIQEY